MDRRDFLISGAALSAAAVLPRAAAADAFAPKPGAWRSFQTTLRLDIAKPQGASQAWVPLPSVNEPEWFRPLGNEWKTNAASAEIYRDPKYGAELLHVSWADGERAPAVEVVSQFATRDRGVDLSKPHKAAPLSAAERVLYTGPTTLIPIDGIVKDTSDYVTAGARTELAKARAIYEWIVDNTFRDPKTLGCGFGDVASMLQMGNLGGKCADLNALYVGLARAAGLPARDVYGVRVAPSRFGYKSLGAGSENVTKAQHCRAEVYISRHGWVPVDPADVRKVVLEEPPGNLALGDLKVAAARAALFGAWEMNWLAYNTAHDLVLPGAREPHADFVMYPQAETGGERLDSLDPDGFKYTILAKELTAA
ncbi:MAG: transglutaminase domain-containing protein [Proteobacteria bacterium]|nr:transglutaminase domain-containing protein [Pseudomonadota bacterium]